MTELTKQDQEKIVTEYGAETRGRTSARNYRRIFQVYEGHRSKQTAAKYEDNFNHFLDFIRIHDLDVLLDLGKEAIQELVIRYVLSMRDNPDKRYSRRTVSNRVSSILYFLDNNDIELNKRKIRRYFPSDELSIYDADRPYTTEEIQRILVVSDLRTKVMILLMASAGLRIGALPGMQIGHLIPVTFNGFNLYQIQVYAGTRDKYFTFCTPECYNAIQVYLEYRKRYGEELKDKSPLFRKHFNKLDPFRINKPKFLTANPVIKAVDDALKKSGVKTSEAMRSHAFRKGFMSICEHSGMKSINVKMLLGHDIGVSSHYYRPAENDLLEDYMTHAADLLTIDPTKKLQQKVKDLEGQQSRELGDLREQFNEMKRLLVHLKKGTQKKLVEEFEQRTSDELQDEVEEYWSQDKKQRTAAAATATATAE